MITVAHQRLIRERNARFPESKLEEKRQLAATMRNASVREISYEAAKNIILAYEWLGNMGTTDYTFGLFFGQYMAGAVCFGRSAGNRVATSVCGPDHADQVITLGRGACKHWAHPHSASFLIARACRQMAGMGFNIFVAYSDPQAGEIGTVYQACNWLYCGTTGCVEQFRTPEGKIQDGRHIKHLTRDRTGGTLKYKRTRAEQKRLMLNQGYEFFKGSPKHRYLGLYGDRRTVRLLRSALRWTVLSYPKRPGQIEEGEAETLAVANGLS